jgi:ferredoxin
LASIKLARTQRSDELLRIEINAEKCMGSGNCLFWAPGVFELSDDGIAFVVDPTAATERQIMQAVEGCPTQAIAVSEG